jgi:hypothetical protein
MCSSVKSSLNMVLVDKEAWGEDSGLAFFRCLIDLRLKGTLKSWQTMPKFFLLAVVDDNAVNRIVAAGALKKYGAIVTCVDSGKEAISRLQPPHKFDACFMDVQMPEMDG